MGRLGLSVSALLVGVVLVQAGCNRLECAKGTREEGGRCVPLAMPSGDAGVACGPNTYLVGNQCIPSEDICGPNTKVESVTDDAGVTSFVCKGLGGSQMPTCPDDFGPAGEFCVTGQVVYFVDDQGNYMKTALADPNASEDATWLKVEVYDPIEYAHDPTGAVPIATTQVDPKTGYFKVTGVPEPANGSVAMAIDELDPTHEDVIAQTATPYTAKAYQNIEGVSAFVVTTAQVADWTAKVGGDSVLESIGCAAPEGGGERDLLNCGTWLGVYRKGKEFDPGPVVEGVEPRTTNAAGSTPIDPETTFYMGIDGNGEVQIDDPTAGVVWTDGDGPHEWTGVLGAVIRPKAGVRQYTGNCGPGMERCGCLWKAIQGGSVPGVILIQFMFPNSCND